VSQPVTKLNVSQEADLLIRQHGENAELEAARLANLMHDRGDKAGSQEWEWVRRDIEARRVIAALQPPPHMSDLRSARPVSSEEDEVIAVAERMKQDLSMAIAAGQVVFPAAFDEELIRSFNIGHATAAFELVRHSLLFYRVMALMRLWDDTRDDVRSILRLEGLLSDASLIQQLVDRERQATQDIKLFDTMFGPGEEKLPLSVARSTPEQRESELRTQVSSWRKNVNIAKGHAEIARLRKFRHEIYAHSAGRSRLPKVPLPQYGEERKVLEKTIPIASEGFYLATGKYHDFSTNTSMWDLSQQDMWEIVRSAARGERYSPPPRSFDDVVPVLSGEGSITIKG
jgi:AbiU2